MNHKSYPSLAALDLEGVLVPEIWSAIAEYSDVVELSLTTRDVKDYRQLMNHRIEALNRHGITLNTIKQAAQGLKPFTGAVEFLEKLRSRMPVVVLSDTFTQLASPLVRQLGWPTVLCHSLVLDGDRVVDYKMRLSDQKTKAVAAFQSLNYRVVAAGDSYNDVSMLTKADKGILFRASENILTEYSSLPSCTNYEDLLDFLVTDD